MSEGKFAYIPAAVYRSILEHVPIVTVDVLFLNPDRTKTLLFKRVNEPLREVYFSVGGRLFKNEKLIDCAIRQVLRETGLSLTPTDLIWGGAQDEICDNSVFDRISYHSVNIFYGHTLSEQNVNIKLDEQHESYQWFDVGNPVLHPFIKSKLAKLIDSKIL